MQHDAVVESLHRRRNTKKRAGTWISEIHQNCPETRCWEQKWCSPLCVPLFPWTIVGIKTSQSHIMCRILRKFMLNLLVNFAHKVVLRFSYFLFFFFFFLLPKKYVNATSFIRGKKVKKKKRQSMEQDMASVCIIIRSYRVYLYTFEFLFMRRSRHIPKREWVF